MSNQKIVIIGAGPAGLTAAYELLKKGAIKPIVLEAEDFVGGISRTVEYHGNRMDIGGHRFFTKCDRVNDLWEQLMPIQGAPAYDDKILNTKKEYLEGGPDPETEENVMLLRHRVSRIYFLRKFFDYPISMKLKTFTNMGFGRTVKAGFGYLNSCFHKLPEDSLENFYINRFGKPLYQMFFEDYTTKVWGVSPKMLSASWGAQRVKGLSLRKAIKEAVTAPFRKKQKEVETSLINQFEYPKKGPGQLYALMAEEVIKMGGQIIFGQEVNKIEKDENNCIVAVGTTKGNHYECDQLFSTMPINDLFNALGKDNVPEAEYEVAASLPYRDFITVGLLLNNLKVKNKTKIKTLNNIIPDNWIYVQERSVKMGRIQIFNNWSPYMVGNPEKHVWIGLEYFCNEGDDMWNANDRDFIVMAIKELVSMDIIADEADVLDSCRIKVKKAYPAYYGSYENFSIVEKYLNTIANLFCIGRNGQHRYNNMDHSMLSALTAVDELLAGTNNKDLVWRVNTEKSYHEGQDKAEEKGKSK